MVLAWTGDELLGGQAQNGVSFDFEVIFDLEGQGQSPPKTIGILTKVFYTYGTNLVILTQTGLEISRGQASHWHTDSHTHTDAGDDKTWRPILASDKNGLRNYHNAKISNWLNMGIFNELRCWFSKVSKVLPQWMCITNNRSINETFFYSLCKPCLLHEHS